MIKLTRTLFGMPFDPLFAISSVDGRYRKTNEPLAEHFSEYALIKNRLMVECEYLIVLSEAKGVGIRALTVEEKAVLRALPQISLEDAQLVKKMEREGHDGIPATNHDVKAAEYFVKQKLKGTSLADVVEWVHFALTSEDVNSVAYSLGLRSGIEKVILAALEGVRKELDALAEEHAGTPMLARTHGQSATPTTFGKEMNVFVKRLERQIAQLGSATILAKWGGPSANYNAQMVTIPSIDWPSFANRFIASLNAEGQSMKLALNEVTTQIEPHDTYAEIFDTMRRANTILLDLSQDMWRYISDGWVTQKPKEGEVGSSAMPHKVNPIDFENAEGNLGVANALFTHLSQKLPISRLQRDLSDSTVVRTFGTAFAHSLIAYASLVRGFGKISVNSAALLDALRAHPEVIAEAIHTILRREGVEMPYEKLKALTRGRTVTLEGFAAFIDGLEVSEEVKKRLKSLSPETYTGIASTLARH